MNKTRTAKVVRNVKLTVEYDGTHYHGWQVQEGKPTVQGELVKAIEKVTGKKPTLFGSGRTDAGVHAVGQVANFRTGCKVPARKLLHAINAHLPEDITVVEAADVDAEFHAQFGAKRKTYRYTIANREAPSATRRLYAHLVRTTLDLGKMREAAAHLTGTHDFRAFGSEMSGKEKTTRTISSIAIARDGDFVSIDFTGDGFLYNQVRAMVGTLLRVGLGQVPPAWAKQVLDSKDRRQAASNVPAKGLCLMSVEYS